MSRAATKSTTNMIRLSFLTSVASVLRQWSDWVLERVWLLLDIERGGLKSSERYTIKSIKEESEAAEALEYQQESKSESALRQNKEGVEEADKEKHAKEKEGDFPISLFPGVGSILQVNSNSQRSGPVACATDSSLDLVQIRNQNGGIVGWDFGYNDVFTTTPILPPMYQGGCEEHDASSLSSCSSGSPSPLVDGQHLGYDGAALVNNGSTNLHASEHSSAISQGYNSGLVVRKPHGLQHLHHSEFGPYVRKQYYQPGGRYSSRNASNTKQSHRHNQQQSAAVNGQNQSYHSYSQSQPPHPQALPQHENLHSAPIDSYYDLYEYDEQFPAVEYASSPGMAKLPNVLSGLNGPSVTAIGPAAAGAGVPTGSANGLSGLTTSAGYMVNGVYSLVHSQANSESGSPEQNALMVKEEQEIPWRGFLLNQPMPLSQAHSSDTDSVDTDIKLEQYHHSPNNSTPALSSYSTCSPDQSGPASSTFIYEPLVMYGYLHSPDSATSESTTSPTSASGGYAPFVCPLCDASFRIKGYLTRHMKKHADVKAYTCPFFDGESSTPCHPTGGFSRRDTYKTHLKARHFMYPPGTRSGKRKQVSGECGGCGTKFDSNEAWVEEHIQKNLCQGVCHNN